ncbi:hypothetical protein BHM03_00047822 [Ensete ventricosum]|nr:hypothetical protein BHM03_00047822 [Ensete ventricosum]
MVSGCSSPSCFHSSPLERRGTCCRSKGSLVVAVQVGSVAHPQQVAVPLVEADPIRHPGVGPFPALQPAIDDVGDDTVARKPSGRPVGVGWRPPPGYHVVARRLGRLRGHPEPQSRLEGDGRVGGHQVWVVEQVGADGSPGRPVVVVAARRTQRIVALGRPSL